MTVEACMTYMIIGKQTASELNYYCSPDARFITGGDVQNAPADALKHSFRSNRLIDTITSDKKTKQKTNDFMIIIDHLKKNLYAVILLSGL